MIKQKGPAVAVGGAGVTVVFLASGASLGIAEAAPLQRSVNRAKKH